MIVIFGGGDQSGIIIAVNAVPGLTLVNASCREDLETYSSSPWEWQLSNSVGGLFSSQSEVTSHSSLPSRQKSSVSS